MMNKDDIMTLTDDQGNKVDYRLLDAIFYEDNAYAVFYPTVQDDTEILILRADPNDDDDLMTYNFVEDQRIVDEIFKQFKERHPEIKFQ